LLSQIRFLFFIVIYWFKFFFFNFIHSYLIFISDLVIILLITIYLVLNHLFVFEFLLWHLIFISNMIFILLIDICNYSYHFLWFSFFLNLHFLNHFFFKFIHNYFVWLGILHCYFFGFDFHVVSCVTSFEG
jgi:hypothetical protein